VVVLRQDGHELEEGFGPADIQRGLAVQPAEDAGRSYLRRSHLPLLPGRLVLGPALPGEALLGEAFSHAVRHCPLNPLIAKPPLICGLLDYDVVCQQEQGEHENADHDYVPDFHEE
jgi:hypothetical protein